MPVVRLTEVFRQAADSRIITNAHRIRRGQMPDMRGADPSSDFHFVERDEPEKIAATLVKMVQERIPERFRLDPIRDIQVLCPMNRGSLGVRELNTALQKVLNPARPGQPAVEQFGWRFQIGDKVIQTENDYDKDVFNGDMGIVERIDPVEQQVTVRFDERVVKYDFGELDEISLAYAITIHKSQGSEFPAVVIPLATQHYMLLQRNLIYTGITRGKRLVVLIGQKKALGIAVRNDRPQRRYSGLLASLKGKGHRGSSILNRHRLRRRTTESNPHENLHPKRPADRRRTRPPRRLPRKLQGREGNERRGTRRVLRRPHRGTGDRDAERIQPGGLRRRDVGSLRVRAASTKPMKF